MNKKEKDEISVRETTIAAANKMVEDYKVQIAQSVSDKETADKMVEDYKLQVSQALANKLAADKLVSETKAIADKALADKAAADKIAADYKILMDKAIADKTASDKAAANFQLAAANAQAAADAVNKAFTDHKAAMTAAAAKAKPFGIGNFVTTNQPYTDWKTYTLEKHPVNCGQGVLNRLHLRTDDAVAQYEYSCAYGGNLGDPFNKETAWDAGGNGGNIFLDRQNVECDPGSVLTGVQLIKDPNSDNIKYKYTCVSTPGLTCRNAQTPKFSDGGQNFRYLERHDIKCNSDEVLQKFRLGRPSDSELSYNYTCCKV
jgi:hypothetical protein